MFREIGLLRLSPFSTLLGIFLGSLVLMLFPYVSGGIEAVHFTQDPDMAYLGNGINFLARGEVHFALHPGVPTQILIGLINLPFLIYCKLTGGSFEDWIFQHFDFVVYFNRIAQSVVLSTATMLWTFSIWKMTNSLVSMILAWCFLFIYSEIPIYGMVILNENTGFLILAVWLLLLTRLLHTELAPSSKTYRWLVVLSALGLANKFTNIFMPIITLLIPQLQTSLDFKSRLRLAARYSGLFFLCSALFFWPVRAQFKKIWEWLFSLATHTGIYGTGENSAFSLETYLASVRELLLSHSKSYLVLAASLVFLGIAAISKRGPYRFYWVLIGTNLAVGAIFSKYVLVRYQLLMMLTTYAFGIAAFGQVLAKSRRVIRGLSIAVILTLALPVSSNIRRQYRDIGGQIRAAKVLGDYLRDNPGDHGLVVEVAFIRLYSLLFFRDWSQGLLGSQLAESGSKIYSFLGSTFQRVRNLKYEEAGTMEACWDRLLIQDISVEAFLRANAGRSFEVEKIRDTPTTLIRSSHCTLNKN